MKINKNNFLTKCFFTLCEFLILFYTIYRRIFVIRLPKDLYFFYFDYINYRLIILTMRSLIMCCYLLYKNKELSETFISKIIFKINLFLRYTSFLQIYLNILMIKFLFLRKIFIKISKIYPKSYFYLV